MIVKFALAGNVPAFRVWDIKPTEEPVGFAESNQGISRRRPYKPHRDFG